MNITTTTLAATQERFSELFASHEGIVHKVAATYCWNLDDRKELAQEIVTQLWRGFPRYDDAQPYSTWMYRIALNVAISWVRRHSLRQKHMSSLGDRVDNIPDASQTVDHDERTSQLREFIEGLEPLNRALILLYLEARSHTEIAEILGISKTNVATKISRLKQRLRKQYAEKHSKGTNNGTR